ncbi:MAG: DUF4830 domain-containing protein [Clostridia bacterium]|nr:DUF4830 domain-containing protein [Clostridia bacterium]
MFVCSVKTTRRTLAIGLCCLVAFLVLTATVIWWPDSAGTVETVAAATTQEHLTFLRSIGCEAAAEPMAIEEILIPDTPDEAFETYNALQQQAGFDLSDYHGKRVKKWSYMATCGDTPAVANLYIYRDVLVGGDLTDPNTGEQRALTTATQEE